MATPPDLATFGDTTRNYPSDSVNLPIVVREPAGAPPYPLILFNHGSAGMMEIYRRGLDALVDAGFALAAPVRRGHNAQPGVYWEDRVTAEWGSDEMGAQLVAALHDESRDVVAAYQALRSEQARFDWDRVAIVGSSFGSVVSVMAAPTLTETRAVVSFAGPSQTWPDSAALRALVCDALTQLTVPILLMQAHNDHHLATIYDMGHALAAGEREHELRVYPTIGVHPLQGHGLFGNSVDLWAEDVARFLRRWLPAE